MTATNTTNESAREPTREEILDTVLTPYKYFSVHLNYPYVVMFTPNILAWRYDDLSKWNIVRRANCTDEVRRTWGTMRCAGRILWGNNLWDRNAVDVRPPVQIAPTAGERLALCEEYRYVLYPGSRFAVAPIHRLSGVPPHRIPRARDLYWQLCLQVRRLIADDCRDYAFDLVETLDILQNVVSHTSLERTVNRLREALRDHDVCEGHLPRLSDCGHVCVEEESHQIGPRFSRSTVCDSCFADEVVQVVDDGTYRWREDVYYWERDGEYHLNPEPDYDEPDYDEDEDEDGDSTRDPDRRMVYGADVLDFLRVDPSFTTSSSGDFHMGIELETVVTSGTVSGAVRDIRDQLGDDHVICKADASIGCNGIEIVTRPTSLARHLARFGAWKPRRLKAWDAGTCGMHVHIDSRAFTALSLGKFLQFFNTPDNACFLRSIAGRHPQEDKWAQDYAGWDYGRPDQITDPLKALKNKSPRRHVMVNLTNLTRSESRRLGLDDNDYGSQNTVEVRLFRASLRKDRMFAQLEFTHAIVVYCRTASYKNLTAKAFTDWLRSHARQYHHLCKWLGVTNKHGAWREPQKELLAAA
jgi:hypothetical protein